ncbi:MAG: hypothetical protein R3275_03210 [Saprospiraceae bacterium]|nr:hypothetical protein [Saprospiraceae bacterium]
MKTIISLFTFIFILGGLTAQNTTFSDWDKDNDGFIERHEFKKTFVNKYYPLWDPDNERGIIEEGFFQESYAGLDTDNDNMLSDEEWLIGLNYFYDDYIVDGGITVVDTDKDGSIEYAEYYDAIYETGYFTDIDLDADNYISKHELADFVFDNWDLNDSGLLSRAEFNRFDWYYLDV